MFIKSIGTLLGLCLFWSVPLSAADQIHDHNRELTNLRAFARVYGYVRFFYPDQRMADLDWDKLAVMVLEEVRDAKDDASLQATLFQLWHPIAPDLQLLLGSDGSDPMTKKTEGNLGEPILFWQHRGLKITNQPGPYMQRLVDPSATSGPQQPLYKSEIPPRLLQAQITPGLRLEMPLIVSRKQFDQRTQSLAPSFSALNAKLVAIDLKSISPSDWRLPVAGLISVWNVFQHFHPYLDQMDVNWNDALMVALRQALDSKNPEDYYHTLMRMIARSHDGHGYVFGRSENVIGLPIRLVRCGDQLVVSGTLRAGYFQKGDVIEKLDGVDALEVLHEVESCTPGSHQLSEYRALNQLGAGTKGNSVHVDLSRAGRHLSFDFTRTGDQRGYFSNSIPEFNSPAFAELKPGVFYINLDRCDAQVLSEKLPILVQAKGIIFDWRRDGRNIPDVKNPIQPHRDIIPYLIDKDVQASPMMVPQMVQPDRKGWKYVESTWPISPKTPKLKARIIFINEPSVVSYGETCMAVIADYHLATLVGASTAGCNGNANFIQLPGGLKVMWTGMDVRRHDYSSFYTIGFKPDYPVARTNQGVMAGRDEFLEKALDVIEHPRESDSTKG